VKFSQKQLGESIHSMSEWIQTAQKQDRDT